MKFVIYPYKMESESAGLLSENLNAKRVFPDRNYRPSQNDIIINWGNSNVPIWWRYLNDSIVLNKPQNIAIASDKLQTFYTLQNADVPTVDFTVNKNEAIEWIENEKTVVCRKILNSHSGNGIVLARSIDDLIDVPLYTKLVKKPREFRVHVFRNKVIDYIQKKRRNGNEADDFIRSHNNGWVFCRDDIVRHKAIENIAIKAVSSLGLDFGAVDIITKGETEKIMVLEVNTAIGLQGQTLNSYIDVFKDFKTNPVELEIEPVIENNDNVNENVILTEANNNIVYNATIMPEVQRHPTKGNVILYDNKEWINYVIHNAFLLRLSNEKEHLHSVISTLKNTINEQRDKLNQNDEMLTKIQDLKAEIDNLTVLNTDYASRFLEMQAEITALYNGEI